MSATPDPISEMQRFIQAGQAFFGTGSLTPAGLPTAKTEEMQAAWTKTTEKLAILQQHAPVTNGAQTHN